MPGTRRHFFAILTVLMACHTGSAVAQNTYSYNGQKYQTAQQALAAQQRDLDSLVAAVPTVPTPIHAKALIVLPDRDRLRPLVRASLKGAVSDDAVGYSIEYLRKILWSVANSAIKARIFEAAQILERNDTVQPPFEGYDYLVWYQVTSARPDFSGPWSGQWQMKKSGSAAQLHLVADPGVPQDRRLIAIVDTWRQSAAKLDAGLATGPGTSPTATQPTAGAAGNLRRTATGSGIIIAGDGMVLTNDHVVQTCGELRIRDSDGNLGVATVKAHDAQNDLALLKTARHWQAVAQFRDGAGIRQGDGVVALGYPLTGLLSSDVNVTTGIVSALAGIRSDTRFLQLTAPVQPGNSGGPLLDMSGHLVGVVSAKLNAVAVAGATGDIPQNVNFALKSGVVRDFLDANSVPYLTAPAKHALSAADVGDVAKKFTVLIECWK